MPVHSGSGEWPVAQQAILVPDDDQVSSSDTPGAADSLKANKVPLDALTLQRLKVGTEG